MELAIQIASILGLLSGDCSLLFICVSWKNPWKVIEKKLFHSGV